MAAVKICGLKDAAGLTAALAAGARWVGLVFFPRSPRHLDLASAAALAATARGRAEIVAVTVDADNDLAAAIAQAVQPDWIQAHGRETPARVAGLRRFARLGVIKALPIAGPQDFAPMAEFAEVAGMLLFDAKAPPGAALPGGNGAAFDWGLMRAANPPRPWFLSGGLTPANVSVAISASGAAQVDVSSGVERAPGLKDPALIAAFAAAAQTGIAAKDPAR